MNKWIAISFFALLACQLGDGLECYSCEFGLCSLSTSKKTCEPLEVCLTETAQYKTAYLKKKSCASPLKCLEKTEETYLGVTITKTPSCCYTDLCNSAVRASTSAVTALGILLSLWVAWLL